MSGKLFSFKRLLGWSFRNENFDVPYNQPVFPLTESQKILIEGALLKIGMNKITLTVNELINLCIQRLNLALLQMRLSITNQIH